MWLANRLYSGDDDAHGRDHHRHRFATHATTDFSEVRVERAECRWAVVTLKRSCSCCEQNTEQCDSTNGQQVAFELATSCPKEPSGHHGSSGTHHHKKHKLTNFATLVPRL